MPSKPPPKPAPLPYRDINNTTIAYAAPLYYSSLHSSTTPNDYDSDCEALISSSHIGDLTEYDLQHFTATGRPAPAFKASALANLGAGDSYTMPQLLPRRYTDDSIIPAIVVNIIPSPKPTTTTTPVLSPGEQSPVGGAAADGATGRRRSIFGKLRGGGDREKVKERRKSEIGANGLIRMKVVYMPRREYLKFFSRNVKGEYTGTEPFRHWTEEELEREFGQYQPPPPPALKGFDPFRFR